jgi:hypothetical protein
MTGGPKGPPGRATAAVALGLGVTVGVIGRAGDGAAVLFGAAVFAAFAVAILQQTLP